MFPNRPSGRKRWNLHDGPQGSLRRLRNQLAEDGCADSQVVLAKQLLDEKCESEEDKISNFKQALDWLVCATEQGHPEARKILRRCVRSAPLDRDSAAMVRAKSCLKASRQEAVARKAARDLFASLSNGERYITTAQLERRIRDICDVTLRRDAEESDAADDDSPAADDAADGDGALEPSRPLLNGDLKRHTEDDEYTDACESTSHIRNLTVDNLLSAAVDYCQGELPLVSHEMTLTDPGLNALDHIPILQQAFLHPIVFIQVLYLKLLYYFGAFSFRPTNVEVSLILVAYLTLSVENISNLVPLFLYYVSFFAMVVSTFRMLHAKRCFVDFRKWSGLFLRYSDGNLQPDESESMFIRNNLAPFLHFFIALLTNLFLYPFISAQWVPFSEFCVLSFVLMFLTLFSFGAEGIRYPDSLAVVSFGINVLAKYPYEKDTVVNKGWRFLDVHIQNYPSYILGNGIEFCLNARVFFSLLIPVILFLMARRGNWRGFLKYTLPHCVTLSWLQMFITCSHGCTTYGLIRGTLGLVCSFLFLPIIGIVTLVLPTCACLQYVTMSRVLFATTALLGALCGLTLTCLLAKDQAMKRYVTPIQLSLGLIMVVYLGNGLITNIKDEGLPPALMELVDDKSSIKSLLKSEYATDYEESTHHITWDDYHAQCHSPSWFESNMAATQAKCSILRGSHVSWEGYVKNVKIVEVDNKWASFAEYLPPALREYFRCYYGDEYSTLCAGEESLFSNKDCEFVRKVARQSGKSCHLDKMNEYTHELRLGMPTAGGLLQLNKDATIAVLFPHPFTNYTRLLTTHDKIRIRGVLPKDSGYLTIGTEDVYVEGYEISCVECKTARGTINFKPESRQLSDAMRVILNECAVSAKYILNFMLNPVIVIK